MSLTSDRQLEISFPTRRGYLRVSRMTATALAAELDFGVDDLDDLRLAVAEVVNYLVACRAGRVTLQLDIADDEFRMEASAVPDDEADPDNPDAAEADEPSDDVLHAVLGATTDEYGIDDCDGAPRIWLTKVGAARGTVGEE